ncbi:MAG: SUMF1/EgtB/PvdO family nonheme iron enzyme [Opitutaceae bacterium]|nr:SUMF1/EgtB/PvdO family nonheme iron enzyme [Opitutaceae bacterium]
MWKTPPWKNADWRVREQAVAAITDREVLLDLALRDDSAEVRVAAARALPEDALKVRVVREGRCERARREAIGTMRDGASVLACVFDRALPVEVRKTAAQARPLAPADWLRLAAANESEAMRAFALQSMPAEADATRLWDSALPTALKLTIVPRLNDRALLRSIFDKETVREVRIAALRRMGDETTVEKLFYREEDIEMRQALAGEVRTESLLFAMMDDEREPKVRTALVQQLSTEEALARVALRDQDPQVRIAAIQRTQSHATLLEAAVRDADRRVRLAALWQAPDDALRAEIARRSGDEQIRIVAAQAVSSPEVLETLCADGLPEDLRWNAGRRLGRFPVASLAAIRSDWMLAQIASQDPDEGVRETAVRLIRQRETLDALARSMTHANTRIVVEARQHEIIGTAGIRYVPVPGRPYVVSAFPITRGQVRTVLGDPRGNTGEDANLPATGMSPKEIAAFCLALNQTDQLTYRLPSFEEWRHFATAERPNWFRDVRMGTADPEEVARIAMHTGASGPRPFDAAWPNPWGILDALGNVAVWVEDQIGDASWIRYLQKDPLAEGGNGGDARAEEFGLAAGFCWSDRHVRMDRSDRLVRIDALMGAAKDRVGFRLLRSGGEGPGLGKPFKLTLQPEPRWGLSREAATDAVAATKLFTAQQMEQYFRVAPIMLQSSTNYESLRPMKRRLELCGLHVTVTV